MARSQRWLLVVVLAVAGCGGGEPAPQTVETEPVETAGDDVAGEASPASDAEAAQGEPPEGEGEQAEQAEPAAPERQPIEAEDADAIRAALVAAASDGAALARIVDPERGIGAWDREQGQKAHFCDESRFARESMLGYELRDEHEWRCNEELTRCTAVDAEDGTGTLFHLREADGGGRWLDSIIRYHRRVPRIDTPDVTAFVEGAEGVCALWSTLRGSPDDLSPAKLSVFTSRFTEGAEDSSTDFHCGDEAVAAAREQLAPLMQAGPPMLCGREPVHCAWHEADEIRVYGAEDGTPYGVARLAGNLREGPTRLQEREVAAFAQRAAIRRCN